MTVQSGWYSRSASAGMTPIQAFATFRSTRVDLDRDEVRTARRSRDYLQAQITQLAVQDNAFLPVTGQYLPYGSFARSTKTRPLDDIDLLAILNHYGTSEIASYSSPYTYQVRLTDWNAPLARFADNNGNLNSTRILNSLKSGLTKVPNYQRAEIKRNGVAVVLNLRSYSWVFDIVPSVPVVDWAGKTTHYLIPNGTGQWTRTDPRRDQTTITSVNQQHQGNLLPLIRLIKYWNKASYAAPRIDSYYLETMLIDGFRYHYPIISSTLRSHVPAAFQILAARVLVSCPDPKGLGPNLDMGIEWEKRQKIAEVARQRAQYAQWALEYEQRGDHRNAIKWWGYVFPNFSA